MQKELQTPASSCISHEKKTLWHYFDKAINFCAYISCTALIVISVITVADVIMRYAFDKPFSQTQAIGELVMTLLLAFGGTYLLRESDFVRVDLLVHVLPDKVQMIMRVITDIIAGMVFFFVGCGVTGKLIELINTKAIIINSGGDWLHAVYMAPLTLFFFLTTIQFFRNAVTTFNNLKKHHYTHIEIGGDFGVVKESENESSI